MSSELFAIGKVASIFGVSVQTLRHYDKLGLLTPDLVSESSGYRYYGEGKMRILEHILFFKSIGLSLPEIARELELLNSGAEGPEVMLKREQQRISDQIRELTARQETLDRCLELCALPPPTELEMHIKDIPTRHFHRETIEPISPEDPRYLEVTIPARSRLISGGGLLASPELGELASLDTFSQQGQLEFHSLLEAADKEAPGTLELLRGFYLTMAYRRENLAESAAAQMLLDYTAKHSFRPLGDFIFLSRDLLFLGPTGRGDLCEVQLRIEL